MSRSKILIIEDDPHIAKALSIRLDHAGYDVITALDGLQGLKSAIDVKPDLIISDIWMPKSVGFLVAERMKSFGLAETPVIFITAHGKKNLSRFAKEVGAVAFLEKPFDPDELLATIARCLNSRSSSSSNQPAKLALSRNRARSRTRLISHEKNSCC